MTARLKAMLEDVELLDPKLAADLRAELEKPPVLWPDGLAQVVADLVSPSVWNPDSRTFRTLDREVVWVCGHWHDRHGPLNAEQREYMAAVLIQAVRQAVKAAGGDKKKLYSYLKTEMRSRLNNDRVTEGFKRRATRLVDVSAQLSGVAA